MDFWDIIKIILDFWKEKGCTIMQPYDVEVGAGTFHPATFFGVLGDKDWKVAYVQPSRRPQDGRYGENPHRLQHYFQLQVIIKPIPPNPIEIYIESLKKLIPVEKYDIRFIEDDWESPTLGAHGLGWEVRLNGTEITQFTYFQEMGGIELKIPSLEITYGLERIAILVQGVESAFEIKWGEKTYGEIYKLSENMWSKFNFDYADTSTLFQLFSIYEETAKKLLSQKLFLPAYDFCIKCSHTFNILDARGAIGIEKRAEYISRIRNIAKECAIQYLNLIKPNKNLKIENS